MCFAFCMFSYAFKGGEHKRTKTTLSSLTVLCEFVLVVKVYYSKVDQWPPI